MDVDSARERSGAEVVEAEETVDGVAVLEPSSAAAGDSRRLGSTAPGALLSAAGPTVQAAAVAATGFVAGAAALALVRRRERRRLARRFASTRRMGDSLPILGTRSFIVDIHLIGKPGE